MTIERTDASAECDGLLPDDAPVPVTFTVVAGACGPGVSDGTSHVAIETTSAEKPSWQIFDGRGARVGSVTLAPGSPLLPQPEGWQGVVETRPGTSGSSPKGIAVVTLSPPGAVVAQAETATDDPHEFIVGWRLRDDPLGGSALLLRWGHFWSNPAWMGEVRRYTAAGAPFGHPGPVPWDESYSALVAAGVSNRGETAALTYRTGRIELSWIASDGSVVARNEQGEPITVLERRGTRTLTLLPLLDGSLVLREDGAYTRRFPHLAARYEDPPAWLSAREGWTFRFTRGNRGYALFPPRGGERAGCDPVVEVRAPSGRLCGTLTFREKGGACRTRAIDQGWDGTVVQQSGRDACTYRFWPRLLAKP